MRTTQLESRQRGEQMPWGGGQKGEKVNRTPQRRAELRVGAHRTTGGDLDRGKGGDCSKGGQDWN